MKIEYRQVRIELFNYGKQKRLIFLGIFFCMLTDNDVF